MANPATVADIVARWRPLSAAETGVAATLLDDAWSILQNRSTTIVARLAAIPVGVDINLVKMVLTAMVLRVLRNPEGKTQESIEDYCLAPDTKVLCGDLVWRPLRQVGTGDELIAFDEDTVPGARRKLRVSIVTAIGRRTLPSYRVTFADGRSLVASEGHQWLGGGVTQKHNIKWMLTSDLVPGCSIGDIGCPWELDLSHGAGYLAGVFDGEATVVRYLDPTRASTAGFKIDFPQRPGVVLDKTLDLLKERGFETSAVRVRPDGMCSFSMTGMYNTARFLGSCRPERLLAKVSDLLAGKALHKTFADVVAVDPVGLHEVVTLGTTTRTLIAEGLCSHNSYTIDDRVAAGWLYVSADELMQLAPTASANTAFTITPYHLPDPLTSA